MKLKRLFCLLLLFCLTLMMFGISSVSAKTLYIGDSRTVGMAQANNVSGGNCSGGWDIRHCQIMNNTDNSGDKWFCQIGAGLELLKNNESTIRQLAADCDNIVISLGANDLVNPGQANKYAQWINKFTAEMAAQGKTVSVSTVNPIDESKYHGYKNSDIDNFNSQLKRGLSSNVNFIDTNSCIKGNISTADGLHYSSSVNKKVQQCIKKGLTGSGGGQQSTGSQDPSATPYASAGGSGSENVSTTGERGDAGATGEVSCEFDDEQKKQLAERGFNETQAALEKLQEVHQIMENDYRNNNGACHFLYSILPEEGELDASQRGYENSDKKGAEIADEILGKSGDNSTKGNIEKAEDGDLNDYTDWNFSKLRQQAYSDSATLAQIANWGPNAAPGSKQELSSDVKDHFCEKVQCSRDTFQNDCDIIIKINKQGGFACVDQGWGSREIDYKKDIGYTNGICQVVLKEHVAEHQFMGVTIPAYDKCTWKCGNTEGTTDIWECGAVEIDRRDIAYKWDSYDEMMHDLIDDKTRTCEQKLSQAEVAMGRDCDTVDSFFGHLCKAHEALTLLSGELECTCEKDANGEIHGMCKDDPFESAQDLNNCKSVAMYQQDLSDFCITCKLFASIMGAAQKISKNAFETTQDALSNLLGIALLIYIGYMTLITIASPEAQKISKYLTATTTQGLKVAIAVLILQNPKFLYQELLSPVLDGSIDFGIAMTGETGAKIHELGAKYSDNFDQSSEYFSAQTGQDMVGAIENFTDSAALMPAIGRALICRAWTDLGLKRAWMIPRVNMFIEGSIIYIFGIGILLAIGFYMLDCAIELAFVFTLMGFFVACWPFKLTTGYTKVGWNMFMNAFFNFMMMSIIVTTIVRLSAQSLAVGNGAEELQMLVNSDLIEDLENAMDLGGLQMVMVVVCSMMCFKLPKESGRLANKFSGGLQVAMGSSLGGLAAGAVTAVAGRSLRTASNVAGPGARAAANAFMDKTGATGKLKGLAAKAKNTVGRLGLGSKARMGAKGRNPNANNQQNSLNRGFIQDSKKG